MSRFSCVQQKVCAFFVRSKLPMSRLSCVQNLISPEFSAFQTKKSCAQSLNICAFMSDYRAFKNTYVQTFVRSKVLMSRILCIYVRTTIFYNVFISSIDISWWWLLWGSLAVDAFCLIKGAWWKVFAEGCASQPVIKAWFILPLQQCSVILGVQLSNTKQNVACKYSCVRHFVTFELKWVEGMLVESFHLSEHSSKSL